MAVAQLAQLATLTARQIRQSIRGRTKFFVYSTAPVTIPAIVGGVMGQVQALINIDGDSHFFCTGLTGHYFITGTLLMTNPQLHAEPEVWLQDQSTGFNMTDRPVRWGNIIGTGERHFPVEPAYLCRARSAINVTFLNPETVAHVAQVSLLGYKVYLR